MKAAAGALANAHRLSLAQKLVRIGQRPFEDHGTIHQLPGMLRQWTNARDLRPVPPESFRDWWRKRHQK